MALASLHQLLDHAADHQEVAEAAANASSMRGNPFHISQKELLQILSSAS
ncbi:MAG: alcohol dehydrogenase class IV [Paracoccaceae bacterium]|jgi:hypothetical protein